MENCEVKTFRKRRQEIPISDNNNSYIEIEGKKPSENFGV
jgi:hypothetical protein